jgi:predicted NBD/HSP70 family sugar kinase
VAGARAIAARLEREGLAAALPADIVRLVAAGEPAALRAVRDAGRALGEVLATIVNLFGPEVIVLGGALAEVHAELLAGARELIHQRAAPLATRTLVTTPSRLGTTAAVVGVATSAAERVLAPGAVDRALGAAPRRFVPERPSPGGRRAHEPAAV